MIGERARLTLSIDGDPTTGFRAILEVEEEKRAELVAGLVGDALVLIVAGIVTTDHDVRGNLRLVLEPETLLEPAEELEPV